ncbi:hypothetical protein GTQ43_02505 [Nostoc sp. KVJ3]|uniref:hypothetical protein n=1 Tax=Nostoc sp. KVJ3 TaxID=457945 RepID=UPI00223A682A|nr:hypothetical protein [Nostoc sp. KVJ3]
MTKEEKQFNRNLACCRVAVEHVNSKFKVFWIFSQRYRNCRKRFALRCHYNVTRLTNLLSVWLCGDGAISAWLCFEFDALAHGKD